MKFLILIAKNLWRNPLRTVLTALGTMMLVLVVTLVWSVLWFLDQATAQRSENFKAIVTERWSIPSRMPYSYAATLREGAARAPGDVRPLDWMTWQFYVGTVEPSPQKITLDNMVFVVAMDPDKALTMLEGMDLLTPEQHRQMEEIVAKARQNKQGIVMGRTQMARLNKRVGERINLYGLSNFKGLDFEFEILGQFPPGRYDGLAAMHVDYFNSQMDAYPARHGGRKHPLAERSLNIVWLKVPDDQAFNRIAAQIESSPLYSSPPVKVETLSSGVGTFMEAFRDLLWGLRWVLTPACLVTLSLVIATAISISVRERQLEFAVLKVLGFRPGQIVLLVVGEALALGVGVGLATAAGLFVLVNWYLEGIRFPIGFFDVFFVPPMGVAVGAAVGAVTSLAGSLVPAWSARNVKVADVFAKVA